MTRADSKNRRTCSTEDLRFIVHADDCGLTRSISEDILACLTHGCLNSVSVIMGGAHSRESLEILNGMPRVRTCLHLNLLEGRCVAPPALVRPLVREDGFFRLGLGGLLWQLDTSAGARKKALLSAIEIEFAAQIEAFTALYRPGGQRAPLCLDGHLHVHVIPKLRDIMRAVLREQAPGYVRLPQEPAHWPDMPLARLLGGRARRALLTRWARGFLPLLRAEGIAHNDYLCGLTASGSLNLARVRASLEAIARCALPDSLVEIMCHPGGMGADTEHAFIRQGHRSFYLSAERGQEKALLLAGELRELLRRYGDFFRAA